MGLTHAAVVVVPDDPTYPVGSDEWNADHLFTGGAATQVLFQGAAGVIESDAGLTYDKTTDTFTVTGTGYLASLTTIPDTPAIAGTAALFLTDSTLGGVEDLVQLDAIDAITRHRSNGDLQITNAVYGAVHNYGTGAITDASVFYVDGVFINGLGSITNGYAFYSKTLLGGATNPYFLWYDSPGVYRVNGVGIMAYYNPAFLPKYTPGATDYERVVQQWNGNVLEYGLEASGTGTLRALKLIGAGVTVPNLTVTTRTGTPATMAVFTSAGLLAETTLPVAGAPADAQYLTLATNATLTNERVLTPGNGLTAVDAGAGGAYTVTATVGGLPGGRLTLTTAVPVTTSDVTGATTIYYTPYVHDCIELWTGSAWSPTIFTEVSVALGTLTSGRPYDVFGFLTAGALTLELLAWTSATARATAVTLTDGRYTKSGDKTRLLLGTLYTTSTTATADSATNRLLWNAYNRVDRSIRVATVTANHSYTTSTWREWNNGTSVTRIGILAGLVVEPIKLGIGGGQDSGYICWGVNTTTPIGGGVGFNVAGATVFQAFGYYAPFPALGYQQAIPLEYGVSGSDFDNYSFEGSVYA